MRLFMLILFTLSGIGFIASNIIFHDLELMIVFGIWMIIFNQNLNDSRHYED